MKPPRFQGKPNLSVVFAAMAVSHWIEHQTGWSIKKFVRTARRYGTVTIQAGNHTLTAAEPPLLTLIENDQCCSSKVTTLACSG